MGDVIINTYLQFRHRFLRRLKNRLKPLLDFRDLWSWEYESCEACGSCFRLAYGVMDEVWNEVYGSENGCLCVHCLVKQAEECGVEIRPEHFEWLCIFPGNKPSHDIVKYERNNG